MKLICKFLIIVFVGVDSAEIPVKPHGVTGSSSSEPTMEEITPANVNTFVGESCQGSEVFLKAYTALYNRVQAEIKSSMDSGGSPPAGCKTNCCMGESREKPSSRMKLQIVFCSLPVFTQTGACDVEALTATYLTPAI